MECFAPLSVTTGLSLFKLWSPLPLARLVRASPGMTSR